jgi:hypothetical protein
MISLKTDHGPGEGTVMSEQWQAHPIAELFPCMSAADLAAFTADICAHGVREPIWLYEGKILEGRHRYRACVAWGWSAPPGSTPGTTPSALSSR